MVILHLFIDYHYKSIVSIIRERHVLTLHLSTANCRRKLTTGCCCKNTAALYCTCYAIFLPDRVKPQFLKLWSILNAFQWNNHFTLLYRNATSYGINGNTNNGHLSPIPVKFLQIISFKVLIYLSALFDP